MSSINRSSLRAALSADYEGLAKRLTRYLGSADLAREALHETYLRIEQVSETAPVLSPASYLFRIAVNIAKDRRRSDARRLSAAEIADICDIPDETPDPSMIVEGRLEVEDLGKALTELPERRRNAFLAAHVQQMPHSEIAERFGVSVRTIEFDLQAAMEHLSTRLGRKIIRRFGPQRKGGNR